MLYHLDPRRTGTGAEADVTTHTTGRDRDTGAEEWYARVKTKWLALATGRAAWTHLPNATAFPTESAALDAARAAAGFSHVAEKPCDYAFIPALGQINRDTYGDGCVTCGWSRAEHERNPT